MSHSRSRPSPGVFAAIFATVALTLLGLTVVVITRDLDIGDLARDPVAVLDGHPLVGALSVVGVFLWWFAASVCLFAFLLVRSLGLSRSIQLFLLTSGLLTLLLVVDDQFQVHEDLATRYLGLRQREVMAVYLLLTAIYLLVNRSIIRMSEWTLLAAALAFFAASIAFDYLMQATTSPEAAGVGMDWGMLAEDGSKLMGIAFWTVYLVRFSYFALTRRGESQPVPTG